ncbi:MAG TPA: hypothetical protein VGH98_15150 [Gemmatimonadaceae bacterium]
MREYAAAEERHAAAVRASADAAAHHDIEKADQATAAADAAQDEMDELRSLIAQLRREWSNIRGSCGLPSDIGNQDPGASPAQSSGSSPSGGSGGGGRGASGGGGGGAGSGSSGSNTGSAGGGNTGETSGTLEYEWLVIPPPNGAANRRQGFGVLLGRHIAARKSLRLALDSIDHPALLRDSVGVVSSRTLQPNPAPADASPILRTGLEAVGFLEREVADLQDYRVDYGRYLGALDARNTAAATDQANATIELMKDAINSANESTARFSLTAKALEAVLAPEASLPSGARKHFRPSIAPSLEQELESAGLTSSDVAHVIDDMKSTRPDQIDASLGRSARQIAADFLVANALSASGKWPRPPELPELDGAYAMAMAAVARRVPDHTEAAATQAGTSAGGVSSHSSGAAWIVGGAAALLLIGGGGFSWARARRRSS